MEYTQWEPRVDIINSELSVLILVVMEYTQWEYVVLQEENQY